MKILITMLLTFFVAGAAYAYTPPDSCLKMKCPDNYNTSNNTGTPNPDSVRIDTCISSPTFGKDFAKRYFQLKFTQYPFETAIPVNEVKRVSDLREDIPGLKQQFQELEEDLGSIYFLRLTKQYGEISDSIIILNSIVFIYFEKYQDIDYINSAFQLQINSLVGLIYENRAGCDILSVNDLYKLNSKNIIILPNPVRDRITLKFLNSNRNERIIIISAIGIKQYETEYKETIDISFLPDGVYYLVINNELYKFVKVN
jgi:hypothetical protein